MTLKKILFSFVLLCSGAILSAQETNTGELPAGWWEIPKTSLIMKVGGYVKLDAIHDFNPIGSSYIFDVSKIPTDDSKGEATNFNARESRVFLEFKDSSKEIRTRVEGDFYGVNGAFRLRHAFVEYKRWLAGQSWSNFMDENIIPPTLDFEGPLAYAFARHAMIRYKQPLTSNSYLALALEQPSAKGQTPVQAGKFESPLPDLTARYRITDDWGHIQVSAYLASVRYRFDDGSKDDITQVGGNLSTKINFAQNSLIIGSVVYGNGIARYRGASSVGLDANGNIVPVKGLGLTLGVEHQWSPKWSSLVVYNYGNLDNTSGQLPSDLSKTNYFVINTKYHITKTTFIGLEYLGGSREDISGNKGDASRIQFSFKQSFNM